MRPKYLPQLFSLARYRKLYGDFHTPLRALCAASGVFRRPFTLKTKAGDQLTVDRDDMPIWEEYFSARTCRVSIAKDRFRIIPHNSQHPPYTLAGGHNCMTDEPQRWNTAAYRSVLVKQLEAAEQRVFSQHGEDGILAALLKQIPLPHQYVVEFGAYDGETMSNSRNLIINAGWSAFLIEPSPRQFRRLQRRYQDSPRVTTLQSFVTTDNLHTLFAQAGVPHDFAVLSIDVDSIDYYLWESLTAYEPKIVIIEYNSAIAPDIHYVVPLAEAFSLTGTQREGASIRALYELGRQKGYLLIYTELYGANLFFVHESCRSYLDLVELTPEELYQPPQFGVLAGSQAVNGRGYC